MNNIINRGKSLTFLNLCKDLEIEFSVKTGLYDKMYILTNKRKEELVFKIQSHEDIFGYLIDCVIELKYDVNDKFFK
jgi:hypothetical protein